MSNTSRGVMKFSADGLDKFEPITQPVADKAGVPYETISTLKGIVQMDLLDAEKAVVLERTSSGFDLRTVALP